MHPSPFIEAEQISPHAVIIDCRFELSLDGKSDSAGYSAFKQEHISGALYAHLNNDLSAPAIANKLGRYPRGRHPMPSAEQFAQTLSRWGIHRDSEVVVYDDHNCAFAARAWFLLSRSGIGNVRVLNGGFRSWKAKNQPTSRGGPRPTQPSPAGLKLSPECASAYELDAHKCLIDARAQERYLGKSEPLDPVAGHIPGAQNVPFGANFIDGKLRSRPELEKIWNGHLHQRELIHYCGSGVTACTNILVLEHLGYFNNKLFAESWSGWCALRAN